ncbi:unnamed protein product [Angiostrongylus costaricensis]|uniref:IlGF domain-containing protein n=1 Tax=Angiostrongylus costaricensis TaxID=334426 RepID=A0A0R3PSM1_ANGCS|nr:unnamed protein product [Angiostrongylus costaricensis]
MRLTRTLVSICRNQLCGGFVQNKRSLPWMQPQMYSLHLATKRTGIADECCEKRCSFNYLKTYCCTT